MRIEPQPTRSSVLALCAIGVVLSLFGCWILEIRSADEAIYAFISKSIEETGDWIHFKPQGNSVPAFPLYPWLVALMDKLGVPALLSIRFPAILASWLLALSSGLIARKLKDNLSGFIAASVVLLTYAIMHVSSRGQAEIIHAFLLSNAWYAWYWYGPQKQKWAKAWGLAFGLLFLDVLAVGGNAILCFYLPILLTKAPPKVRRQLSTPAHIVPLIFFIALLFWLLQSTQFPFWSWNDICAMTAAQFYNESFIHHFFTFPFKCAYYLLPWTLLAWTPFCEAQKQFEPAGSVGTFFRTVIITNFVAALVTPQTSPLHLLHLVGPMAILLGFHFEVTMRRHTRFYDKLLSISAIGSIACAAAFLLLWLMTSIPACHKLHEYLAIEPALLDNLAFLRRPWMTMPFLRPWMIVAYMLILLIAAYYLLIKNKDRFSLGLRILLTIFFLRLTVICAYYPWRVAFVEYRRPNAWQLMNKGALAIHPEKQEGQKTDFDFDRDVAKVYLHAEAPFRVESFYFNKPVYRIYDPIAELPSKEEIVYFLGTRQPPVPNRIWTPVSPSVNMTPQRSKPEEQIWLTLYCGVLKTDEEMLQ